MRNALLERIWQLQESKNNPTDSSQNLNSSDVKNDFSENEHRKLKNRALDATLLTAISYGLTQSLRLVNNVLLTHLLMPEYFGLMALVVTLTLAMNLLSDVGLLPNVVSSPRGDDPQFLNTAWTIQIIRGLLLWVIASLIAYPLSHFYDPRISFLLPVLSLQMVIQGFASTNLMRAAKNIGVRRLLAIEFSSQLFTMAVTLLWAKLDPSIWALIGGTLLGALARTLLSHIPGILPGEPCRLAWDRDAVKSLISFGKWVMLGTAGYFFATQADRILLGKLVPFAILGVYNIAFTIADIPRQVIQQFSYRVAFPYTSKLTKLPFPEFHRQVLKLRFIVLCVGALVVSLVVNLGPYLVGILYDNRYQNAKWIVPILALGLWHTLMYCTSGDILFALAKPKYNAIGTMLFCITMFICLPVAFHFFGLVGAVICVAGGDIPYYIAIEVGAMRERVSVWKQDLLATGIFLCTLFVTYLLTHVVFGVPLFNIH